MSDPSFQEKFLVLMIMWPVPKPTQVVKDKCPKVSERTVAKELGNLIPYVSNKGCSFEPQ